MERIIKWLLSVETLIKKWLKLKISRMYQIVMGKDRQPKTDEVLVFPKLNSKNSQV
ncbi:unnamed protein product [Paramecium sonneborni]|uniref:Uncharacterized protein n=1 Tax=Paramecium sonneborni TaxID=65129 RepID=A0A8S1QYU9_9CILI|nr:unnamed protein product [Paramecium sonneborni]